MQASFDLFDEPVPLTPPIAPIQRAAPGSSAPHAFGAPKTRSMFREELQAANVSTVLFDVQAGEVTRVSQFIPAGNQCIGLYPAPLKAVGQDMLVEMQSGSWNGVIEWDVAADRPRYLPVPGADDDQGEPAERPHA
ncbi:hypothetical protein LJR290_007464 [Variovorax sp. LjRoot290]|uniref:hypothetical protein n=1 Tax=Variovorax sp. LjRoot290 TaxID=3342316 RepID=UPI003ECEF7C4